MSIYPKLHKNISKTKFNILNYLDKIIAFMTKEE